MQNQESIVISQKQLRAAIKWHEIISGDDSSIEDFNQFIDWLEASKLNRDTYNYVAELDSFIEENSGNLIRKKFEKRRSSLLNIDYWGAFSPSGWPKALAIAAIPLIAICLSIFDYSQITPIIYETKKGETLVVQLKDDSLVDINSNTKLSVEYSEEARLIRLNSGEVFFQVKPDQSRPFFVDMGNHLVRVLGTSFNVKKRGLMMSLSVTEGLVNIRDNTNPNTVKNIIEIPPGAKYEYAPISGGVVSKIPLEHVATWTDGYLVFENEPLSVIIDELDQYFDKNVILDDNIRNLEFSGQVQIARQEEVITLIAYTLNLEVYEKQNTIYLKPS